MVSLARSRRDAIGIAVAIALLAAWSLSLVLLLQVPLDGWAAGWAPFAVAWMTWLFTGLFITAHDAMHGAITRAHPRLNHGLGAIAVAAYAMFDYRRLRRAHRQHHARPARSGDPDWHDGRRTTLLWWFLTFARRYLSLGQMVRLLVVFWAVQEVVATPNFLLFWAVPSLLSVGQLFFFGTYLPHREPEGGHTNRHHATSTPLGRLASLATCFHFGGYHLEHHEHPSEPWWRLPQLRPAPSAAGGS